MALIPFQSLSWFEINGLPDLQSFNRWSTWNLEPEVFMFSPHFLRSFTILAEFPLGNSTFMAKDGPDTSAGHPRCETSNFGIHAVLTLEADMMKTCENNKLVGIKSGLVLTRFLDESGPKISTFNFTVLFTNVRGICFNFLQVFTDWPRFL